MNRMRKSAVAVGLTAGLLGGGAAGVVLGTPGLSGAQEDTTSTTVQEEADRGAERRARVAERLQEILAPLVQEGTIDQAQADAVVTALQEAGPPEGRRGPGGPGGPGHHRGAGMDAAAEALGLSDDELREQLRGGSSLAEVAEAQGVDVQVVIDALVAELSERLAERVESGDLTQEEADEKLAEATERITERVQQGPPERSGDAPGEEDGGTEGD